MAAAAAILVAMTRPSAALLLFLLLPAGMAAAQPAPGLSWPVRDVTRSGDYNELTRTIATTDYRTVLEHPVVSENSKG